LWLGTKTLQTPSGTGFSRPSFWYRRVTARGRRGVLCGGFPSERGSGAEGRDEEAIVALTVG